MPFFNEAQIGLKSSTYGHIVLGRQYNVLIEGAVFGGYASNPWIPSDFSFQPELTISGGAWGNNQIQYHGRYKDLYFSTTYSVSGNAGHRGYGSRYGVAAAYVPPKGPITLGGALKQTKDSITGSDAKARNFGGSYTWNKTRFALGYIAIQNDKGFSTFANGPFTAQGLATLKYLEFKRRRMILGNITWQPGAWHVAGNAWRTLQAGKTQP